MKDIKSTRKLMRGLKDISPYFLSGFPPLIKPPAETTKEVPSVPANGKLDREESLIPPQPPALDRREPFKEPFKKEGLPEPHCFTILPFPAHSQLLNSRLFTNELALVFSEIYALSFSVSPAVNFFEDPVRSLAIPPFQIEDILHPEPLNRQNIWQTFDSVRRAGFFLDPRSMFEGHADLFQLLDHIILHISAKSSDSILAAYQMLSACLHRNPVLRFSLLIEGSANDDMSEMIYERFSDITSQFLSCEIDFLGWINNIEIQINRDLLLDQGGLMQLSRKPIKTQLVQLLSQELLLEAA